MIDHSGSVSAAFLFVAVRFAKGQVKAKMVDIDRSRPYQNLIPLHQYNNTIPPPVPYPPTHHASLLSLLLS